MCGTSTIREALEDLIWLSQGYPKSEGGSECGEVSKCI